MRGVGLVIEVMKEFVDGLTIVLLNIFELLCVVGCTMAELRPLPTMGIFSRKFLG